MFATKTACAAAVLGLLGVGVARPDAPLPGGDPGPGAASASCGVDPPDLALARDMSAVPLRRDEPAMTGDAEYGAYLSQECAACHQTDGGSDAIPAIAGWPADDLVAALLAYREKLRPDPSMQMIAARLDDDQIAALAAYYAKRGETDRRTGAGLDQPVGSGAQDGN